MGKLKLALEFVIEELEKAEKKYNFEKEFNKQNKESEPKGEKVSKDPIIRMIKNIKDGDGSIEELEKLIKDKNKEKGKN